MQGAGVFVSINATDFNGRKKKNMQIGRAWFVDIDNKLVENPFDITSLKPKPTIIVQTGHGYHLYWVVDKPFKFKNEDDIVRYECELKGINSFLLPFGADPQVCDVNRVMRLPGLFNRKQMECNLVKLLHISYKYFSREEIYDMFHIEINDILKKEKGQKKSGDIIRKSKAVGGVVGEVFLPAPGREKVLHRASLYLKNVPPAIEGKAGGPQTYKTALKLMDGFDLSQEECLYLLLQHYNPRCIPPWNSSDLKDKIEAAAKHCSFSGYLLKSDRNSHCPDPQECDVPFTYNSNYNSYYGE
jgi:hypothetical protein